MCVFFCTFEGTCLVKWQGCTFEGTDLAMLAHLESTATLRSPYFIHSHIFGQIRLRLMNLFFTPHFYMQASNVGVFFCTFGHLPVGSILITLCLNEFSNIPP